jgi:hypothetical protein
MPARGALPSSLKVCDASWMRRDRFSASKLSG